MKELNIQILKEWVKGQLKDHQPEDAFSFIQGVECALCAFAISRFGEKYFGARDYTTRELAAALKQIEGE